MSFCKTHKSVEMIFKIKHFKFHIKNSSVVQTETFVSLLSLRTLCSCLYQMEFDVIFFVLMLNPPW